MLIGKYHHIAILLVQGPYETSVGVWVILNQVASHVSY